MTHENQPTPAPRHARHVRHGITVAAAVAAPLAIGLCASGPAQAGTTGWTQQSLPGGSGAITTITSVGANTQWAAGFAETVTSQPVAFTPLVLSRDAHSQGAWKVVPTPAVSGTNSANAISAAGPGDVWLTGDTVFGPGAATVLAEHWNGRAWSVINAPLPPTARVGELLGVTTISPDNAWAVGHYEGGPEGLGALIEHWNGHSWQIVAPPASGSAQVDLLTVTALNPHDLWAAGEDFSDDEPVLFHGNGTSWQKVTLPGADASTSYGHNGAINALVPDGAGGLYLIGVAILNDNDQGHALIEHWDGKQWRTTPQATPYGELLKGRTWQSLNLPAGGSSTEFNAVFSTRGGLTALGSYTAADNPDDDLPLVLQGRP